MWPVGAIKIAVERRLIMNFLKKYWGTISAIAIPMIAFLEPSLHAYAVANPNALVAVIIGALLTMYHSTAPKDKTGA
jgi:hypothetical protein